MPSTITAYQTFNSFTANTIIKSAKMNENFGNAKNLLNNHRGDLLPINTDTATASDNTHDIGASTYTYKDMYFHSGMFYNESTVTTNPPEGFYKGYIKNGVMFIRDTAGAELIQANLSGAQTFTSKIIDADNNTITNLEHGSEVDNPSSGVHGVVGNVVGDSDAQTLTSKELNSCTYNESDFIHQSTTPSVPPAGHLAIYAKSDNKFYSLTPAGAESEIGAGGGTSDYSIYETLDADNDTYADFDTSGITNAVFTTTSTNPLSGVESYLLQNTTTAANEWIATPAATVPQRSQNKTNAVELVYHYDGVDDAVEAYLFNNTTATTITSSLVSLEAGNNKRVVLDGHVLDSTTSLELRFKIATAESAELRFNDLTFTDDPFAYKDITETETVVYTGYTSKDGSSFLKLKTEEVNTSSNILSIDNTTQTRYTFLRAADFVASGSSRASAAGNGINIYLYDSGNNLRYISKETGGGAGYFGSPSLIGKANEGDYLLIYNSGTPTDTTGENFAVTAWAQTEHIVTPKNTPKQYSEADGDFAVTGTNWTTTEATAIYYVEQTGKHRLKGYIQGTTSAGASSLTLSISGVVFKTGGAQPCAAQALGTTPYTASAIADSGNDDILIWATSSSTAWRVSFDVELDSMPTWASGVGSVYLGAEPVQQVMYLKDVKANGTAGGAAAATTVQTRVLNTIEGVTLGTLSSNQFTLPAGTYDIDAIAPSWKTNYHHAWIQNTTDAAVEINGSVEYTNSADAVLTTSKIKGRITITDSKTFELQHYTNVARAADGLGLASVYGSESEVYSVVKITKVK